MTRESLFVFCSGACSQDHPGDACMFRVITLAEVGNLIAYLYDRLPRGCGSNDATVLSNSVSIFSPCCVFINGVAGCGTWNIWTWAPSRYEAHKLMSGLALGTNFPRVRPVAAVITATIVLLSTVGFSFKKMDHDRRVQFGLETKARQDRLDETKKFVEGWLDEAFDFWIESRSSSRELARAKMSPEAQAAFAKIFWSSAQPNNVTRSLVLRSWDYVDYASADANAPEIVEFEGALVAYQSNCGNKKFRLRLTIENGRSGRKIDRCEVLKEGASSACMRIKVSEDEIATLKKFVDDACRGLGEEISKDAILLYEEGSNQFRLKDFGAAIAAYKAALIRCPRFALAHYAIAEVLHSYAIEKLEKCHYSELDEYQMALKLNPNLFPARLGKARCFEGMGDYSNAQLEYSRLIKDHHSTAEFWARRGYIFYCQGDSQSAIADFNKAIELDPDSSISYAYLAWVNCNAGDYVEAERLCGEASIRHFNNGILHMCRAHLAMNRKDYASAIRWFNGALLNSPELTEIYAYRAWCYEKRGHDCWSAGCADSTTFYANSIADYDRAIKLEPSHAAHYMNRGWSKFMSHTSDWGLEDLSSAINLDPSLSLALIMRSTVFNKLGLEEKSHADKVAAVKITPTRPSDYYIRFRVQKDLGDKSGAIESLSKYLESNPVHHGKESIRDAYSARALLRCQTADFLGALADYVQGLRI